MLPLHPKLVHLPIALAVLMPLVSGGVLVAWWRGWLPRRTWLVPVVLLGVLLGSGLLAQRTGEQDEERVEAIVPEAALEAHEEAAEVFVIGAAVVLVLAAAGAALRNERTARLVAAVATAGTFVVLLLGYRVGEAGGRLVYEHGAATAFAHPTAAAPAKGDHDDDD
jgi:uncharacterized membrane protein